MGFEVVYQIILTSTNIQDVRLICNPGITGEFPLIDVKASIEMLKAKMHELNIKQTKDDDRAFSILPLKIRSKVPSVCVSFRFEMAGTREEVTKKFAIFGVTDASELIIN